MPLSKVKPGIDDNSDATAITIDSSENVGIGETAPVTPLTIATANKLGATFTGNTNGEGLTVTQTDYTSGNYVSLVEAAYDDSNDANPNVRIGAMFDGGGSNLAFGTSNSYSSGITNTAMFIDSVGKVGIGDSSPDSPLEVRKDNPDNGRLATFGSNGTPFTSVLSGLSNSISIGRSRINVSPNTTTNLVSGYGGSVVLVTLLHDSGVADVQRTVLVSHAWSGATVLFENNYGGNNPTVTFSALSGALRVNHNHSGNIQFNVAGFIISGPNSG